MTDTTQTITIETRILSHENNHIPTLLLWCDGTVIERAHLETCNSHEGAVAAIDAAVDLLDHAVAEMFRKFSRETVDAEGPHF